MEASQSSPIIMDVSHVQSPTIYLITDHVVPAIAQGTTTPVRKKKVTTGEEGQGFRRETQVGSYEKAGNYILSLHPTRGTLTMPFNVAASTASEVFNKMASLNDTNAEFVNLLDTNIVDIEQALIGDFNYNEMDGGVDGNGGEDDVDEIDEGVYDQAQAKKA
ncbi:putative galacturonosyltransferase 14 [Hordeum vulgare]|nr:putative galacturonosyltransferase 14 [Hordeum vulgare]